MQAVYQVALQHHMRLRNETYGQWLYEALFRCHLSMNFAKTNCPQMSGALFSGRRTGHHLFTLAQVLYHSRFNTSGSGGKCIGTSSVDAWYTLSKVLKFPGIVPPAGTHAHELSMVCYSTPLLYRAALNLILPSPRCSCRSCLNLTAMKSLSLSRKLLVTGCACCSAVLPSASPWPHPQPGTIGLCIRVTRLQCPCCPIRWALAPS